MNFKINFNTIVWLVMILLTTVINSNAAYFLFICCSLLYMVAKLRLPLTNYCVVTVVSVFLLIPPTLGYTDNNSLGSMFTVLSFVFSFLFAFRVLTSRTELILLSKVLIYYIFGLVVLGLIYSIVVGQRFYITADNLLPGQSRNMLSYYVFFSLSFYLFSNRINDIKPSLVIIGVGLIFSVLLYGRSGIGFASALFLISVAFYCKKRVIAVIGLIVIPILVYYYMEQYYDVIELYITNYTKFGRTTENVRLVMLVDYLDQLTFSKFFLGQQFTRVPSIMSLGSGSPHNSYIWFLANFGFNFLLFLLVAIFSLVLFLIHDRFLFSIFLLFLMRSFFEVIIFPGSISDVFLFIMLLYPIKYLQFNKELA
ncbi:MULTISPECIES: hypothetical protein [unclassified Vibrio]|uniref:hypothetical protein n=1 Tax=unclassified Vibrio TaxID=2614977 RepID=UPI00159D03B5|nr:MULTISPECIES: hypothetical protein [unclassified Vibrio]NVN82669.1 hypothetical protein [Vibrio sp. Scap16]QLE93204.1 hypothetical protein FLM53_09165 [Vibrio sp. Scap24]